MVISSPERIDCGSEEAVNNNSSGIAINSSPESPLDVLTRAASMVQNGNSITGASNSTQMEGDNKQPSIQQQGQIGGGATGSGSGSAQRSNSFKEVHPKFRKHAASPYLVSGGGAQADNCGNKNPSGPKFIRLDSRTSSCSGSSNNSSGSSSPTASYPVHLKTASNPATANNNNSSPEPAESEAVAGHHNSMDTTTDEAAGPAVDDAQPLDFSLKKIRRVSTSPPPTGAPRPALPQDPFRLLATQAGNHRFPVIKSEDASPDPIDSLRNGNIGMTATSTATTSTLHSLSAFSSSPTSRYAASSDSTTSNGQLSASSQSSTSVQHRQHQPNLLGPPRSPLGAVASALSPPLATSTVGGSGGSVFLPPPDYNAFMSVGLGGLPPPPSYADALNRHAALAALAGAGPLLPPPPYPSLQVSTPTVTSAVTSATAPPMVSPPSHPPSAFRPHVGRNGASGGSRPPPPSYEAAIAGKSPTSGGPVKGPAGSLFAGLDPLCRPFVDHAAAAAPSLSAVNSALAATSHMTPSAVLETATKAAAFLVALQQHTAAAVQQQQQHQQQQQSSRSQVTSVKVEPPEATRSPPVTSTPNSSHLLSSLSNCLGSSAAASPDLLASFGGSGRSYHHRRSSGGQENKENALKPMSDKETPQQHKRQITIVEENGGIGSLEEHFRKSLGEDYSKLFNSKTDSVRSDASPRQLKLESSSVSDTSSDKESIDVENIDVGSSEGHDLGLKPEPEASHRVSHGLLEHKVEPMEVECEEEAETASASAQPPTDAKPAVMDPVKAFQDDLNMSGCTVEDHFAKALGETWVRLQAAEQRKKESKNGAQAPLTSPNGTGKHQQQVAA